MFKGYGVLDKAVILKKWADEGSFMDIATKGENDKLVRIWDLHHGETFESKGIANIIQYENKLAEIFQALKAAAANLQGYGQGEFILEKRISRQRESGPLPAV